MPRTQNDVEDIEHRLVLKHAAVTAQRHEGGKWLDDELVARQASVGAGHFDASDVPVKGTQIIAAGSGEQLQQHRLPEQGLERDARVCRQCAHLKPKSLADALFTAHAFGQQAVVP